MKALIPVSETWVPLAERLLKDVPTPVDAALTAMIREIEAGARPISPSNLEELVR